MIIKTKDIPGRWALLETNYLRWSTFVIDMQVDAYDELVTFTNTLSETASLQKAGKPDLTLRFKKD